MASYRAAVVGAWAELRDADRAHFGDLGHLPPRERLAQMMASHRRSAGPERVRRAFRRRFRLSGRWSWATGVVPALALLAAMPALGSAERAADIYTGRLSQRFRAYEGVMQKDMPVASVHLGQALVRGCGRCAACWRHRERSRRSTPRAIPWHAPCAVGRGCRGTHRARIENGDQRPARRQRPFPGQSPAAHQTRRRCHRGTCGVRLRHQPRTGGRTDN